MSSMNPPTGDPLPPPTGHPLPPSYEQYPQAIGTPRTEDQPYEQYPELTRTLHTDAGFKANVLPMTKQDYVCIILFVFGLVLIPVIAALHTDLSRFVWCLAVIIDGFVFLMYPYLRMVDSRIWDKLPAKKSKIAKRFNQGGFIANLVRTDITHRTTGTRYNGSKLYRLYVLADPSVPAEWATSAAQHINASASSVPEYAKGVPREVTKPANQIDPSIPAGIHLIFSMTDGRHTVRAVVPESSGKLGVYQLYPLKETAVFS